MSRQDTVYSSFIFLTNVVVAYIYEYYVYSVLFGVLFITSIIVHVNAPNLYTNLLDKCVIGGIVLYGGYVFSRKCRDGLTGGELGNATIATMIVFTFLATIFLYVYGFFYNKFVFSKDLKLAKTYHALMHFIGSFGHHLIVLL
jgi:hypothetical protein